MTVSEERNLPELYSQLMGELESLEDSIGTELYTIISGIGSYTQEVLMNSEEIRGGQESALGVACRLSKPHAVYQLLSLQAIPTLEDHRQLMKNNSTSCSLEIANLLIRCTQRKLFQKVFWLACVYNRVEIASLYLGWPEVDSNIAISPDIDLKLTTMWPFSEIPLPIQYAAYQGWSELVECLEDYADDDRNLAYHYYVDYLLIAAFTRNHQLVRQILDRRQAKGKDFYQVFEIIGAMEIIFNSTAAGKSLWKLNLSNLHSYGGHKSRLATDIMLLEPHLKDFRTVQEIEAMRAKELRIQALNVTYKSLANTYLFTQVLLARDYSKNISVFTLDYLLDSDLLTAANLYRVETSLGTLGFFLFPDFKLLTKCLQWCIRAAGHLRCLLGIKPMCYNDLYRFQQLVKFTARILLTVERVEGESDEIIDVPQELNHVLRRVISVFQPLNEVMCLLKHLSVLKSRRQDNKLNIFEILTNASADLRVFDRVANVVTDYSIIPPAILEAMAA